jgi:tetratricopeptide (TPR) repeat protein
MNPQRLIFISAVSNEFHHGSVEQWRNFQSYRDVLKHAFHNLDRGYKVLTQEDLVLGLSGLLETLDREIAGSLLVIHLVGELSGVVPQLNERRRLYKHYGDLWSEAPELRAAIGDGNDITYTQWELYLAFHHDKPVLVFEAQPAAPRSPRFAATSADLVSQTAHRQRIELMGHHRGTFRDQGDVARKSIRSFIHWRTDPTVDPDQTLAEDLVHAREHQGEIVKELVAAIKRPDPKAVPASDPANTAAFIAGLRAVGAKWRVNMATVIDIAANYEEQVRTALSDEPTSEALYEDAFATFALGDFTAAGFSARRAADVALASLEREPESGPIHHEDAEKALLLLHDVARAAYDTATAIASLEEAADLIDKETDPLRWADVSQSLVKFLLEEGLWDRAEDLLSDVIDIREDHQGENDPALAGVLLIWCTVLDVRTNYSGMESVAARAERIFASQMPIDVHGIIAALSFRGRAVHQQNRVSEAEEILRQCVALAEATYGADAGQLSVPLGNLAELFHLTNRLDEAEELMRRTLLIDENIYGYEHPRIAAHLNNLASLLRNRQKLEEAEQLFRQALAIEERRGWEHPVVASLLKNLGELLLEARRLNEAEPLIRRALEIEERSYGPDHPKLASSLNNLAFLLMYNQKYNEAEPVIRRAIGILEKNYGTDNPQVTYPLNTLGLLLMETGRFAEAEPLLLRAVLILNRDLERSGYEHPNFKNVAHNYQLVRRQMGREP